MASGTPRQDTLKQVRAGNRPRAHAGSSDIEQSIFNAMEQLLESTPAHEISVAQIIEQAGVSRATFYFYFSSKYAVLTGLLAQISDRIFDVVRPWLETADSADPHDALRASLVAASQVWHDHRYALRAVAENWRTNDELGALWAGIVERFATAVASEIDRERRTKQAPPGLDSRHLAAALVWSAERLLYVGSLGEDKSIPDEKAAVTALTVLWTSSIYGEHPRSKARR
jgi:AcrR family transcriptional regulator